MVRLKKDSAAWVFTVGGISGILSWIFTYPIDMVKTRLQADTIGAGLEFVLLLINYIAKQFLFSTLKRVKNSKNLMAN